MTSAPRLHKSCVQNGPGRRRVKSRTVIPSRAAGMASASRGCGINLRARLSRLRRLRNHGWGRSRRLAEVEAIHHIIRGRVPLVQRREAEVRFAEFHQAHVRVKDLRDVAVSRVGTQDDAPDPRTESKLAAFVAGTRVAVPYFCGRRLDVIVPSSPIVPGDEHRDVGPESTPERSHSPDPPSTACLWSRCPSTPPEDWNTAGARRTQGAPRPTTPMGVVPRPRPPRIYPTGASPSGWHPPFKRSRPPPSSAPPAWDYPR